MTDISIGTAFVTAQTAQVVQASAQQGANGADTDLSGKSFMQSLQQNKTADADPGQAKNTADASPKAPSEGYTEAAEGANVSGTAKTDGENSAEGFGSAETAAEETAGADSPYETVSSDGFVNRSNVKVDEEAVKELQDLSESGNINSEAEEEKPSLLQQAKEALEQALLKAFKELNDPEKKQEEFEEKALIFLMKLVDKINGKDEKETALTDEKDEDEEKIGGTLLQIIDNMLKNAQKNAEENGLAGEQGIQKDEWIKSTDFVDVGSDEERAREAIKVNGGDLKLEHFSDYRKPIEDYRIYDPMTPKIQSVPVRTAENASAESSNVSAGQDEVRYVSAAAAEAQTDGAANIGYTEIGEADEYAAAVGESDTAKTQELAVNRGDNLVKTEMPIQRESVSYGVTDKAQQIEAPLSVPTAERVDPTTENQSAASYFGQSAEHREADKPQIAETVPSETADKANYSEEAAQTASRSTSDFDSLPETKEHDGRPEISLAAAKPEENPADMRTVEDAEYEEIAEKLYREFNETVKLSVPSENDDKAGTIPAELAKTSNADNRDEANGELEELARLFGIDKKDDRLMIPQQEEENEDGAAHSDNKSGGKQSEAFKVPVEDISVVSAKVTDAPIAKAFGLTESGVKQIVTQIVSEILNNVPQQNEETTLMMTLNPETLGRISVKLVENAGKLSVTITAESRETAAILASRAESVQESMRDSGTQLEKYQVVYSAEQDGRAEQQNYDGSSKNPYVRQVEEHDDDNEGQFAEMLRSEAV